eukprot:s33_g12.t1
MQVLQTDAEDSTTMQHNIQVGQDGSATDQLRGAAGVAPDQWPEELRDMSQGHLEISPQAPEPWGCLSVANLAPKLSSSPRQSLVARANHASISETIGLLLLLWCQHRYWLYCDHSLPGLRGRGGEFSMSLRSPPNQGDLWKCLESRGNAVVHYVCGDGAPSHSGWHVWLMAESGILCPCIPALPLGHIFGAWASAAVVEMRSSHGGACSFPATASNACGECTSGGNLQLCTGRSCWEVMVGGVKVFRGAAEASHPQVDLGLNTGGFYRDPGRGSLALEGVALSAQQLDIALQQPGMDHKAWPEVLRFEWFCGHDIEWSWTHHGLVLDTPGSIASIERQMPKAEGTSRDLRLVLFDASLEEWLRPSDAWGMETYTAPWSFEEWSASALLPEVGVSILWRLSIRHIEFVRHFSGATPVTSLAALPAWQEVGSVELKRICNRDYVILTAAMMDAASLVLQRWKEGSLPDGMVEQLVAAPMEVNEDPEKARGAEGEVEDVHPGERSTTFLQRSPSATNQAASDLANDRRLMGAAATIGGAAGTLLMGPVSGVALGAAALYAATREGCTGSVARKAGTVYLNVADTAIDEGIRAVDRGVKAFGTAVDRGCRQLETSASVPTPIRVSLQQWRRQSEDRIPPKNGEAADEAEKIRSKYPDRVPVICEKSTRSTLPVHKQIADATPERLSVDQTMPDKHTKHGLVLKIPWADRWHEPHARCFAGRWDLLKRPRSTLSTSQGMRIQRCADVVVTMLSWALLVKDPCDTADGLLSELSKTYGSAFSCGIIRIGAYLFVAFTVLPQTYALWCVWSFCEDLRVGIHSPELSSLMIGQDAVFVKNPQEPLKQSMRNAQYGAVPVGGEHPIFGSEHETNYPPGPMY